MSIATQKAERIIAANTRSEELNLEGLGIEDLKPLIPVLSQMTRLRRLKLGRNKLSGLPEDLTCVRSVEFLDLSGNPIAGLSAIVHGLYCLTNLKHIYVDTVTPDEEETIIAEMASLISINGTPLSDDVDEEEMRGNAPSGAANADGTTSAAPAAAAASTGLRSASNGINMTTSLSPNRNLPPIAAKSRWDDGDTAQVQRVYQVANAVSGRSTNRAEFEDYTKSVLAHLQQLIQTEEDPLKREAQILTAKKILFEYCFCEVVRGSQRFDPVLAQSLETLQDTYAQLLSSYERLTKNIFEEKARRVEEMRIEMQKPIQEIESLMAQLEAKEGGAGGNSAAFDQERRKYVEEIGWLRTENEKLQTRLRQSELARQSGAGAFNSSRSLVAGASSPSRIGAGDSMARPTPPPIGSKVLTQRQLRDCIEEIYASKSKYDIKCAETHLPRETMEQHMYTHLNQKYGLKHIILEWATAIIQGIKKFSAEDNDVAVFGKILRNEIDEEFRFVQRQLKETVHELLRVYVKGKLPLKSDEEINNIVKRKTTSTLAEEEWIDIVKYMYNNEDAVSLIMRVRDILKQKDQPRRRQTSRRGAAADDKPPQIGYAEFLRTLLDFQLEGHERFLSRFVRVFKQHDTDRNGVVNEQEFRMVLMGIDPAKTEEEVAGLLDLIDPHNNQLISFSECVTFLSTELVKLMKEEGV